MRELLTRAVLSAIQAALAEMPENSHAFTYTIRGFDGSAYLSRTLLPRVLGVRPLIHHIWRDDADPHFHNHPWQWAKFLIVSGGYLEAREEGERVRLTMMRPGDVNHLTADTYHRVTEVQPGTMTLGILGPRTQGWGFKVDGALVPFKEYFARRGHIAETGSLS